MWSRRRLALVIGSAVALVAALLSAPSVVRSVAHSKALARGFEITIERVRFGLGEVRLGGVGFRHVELAGVAGQFDEVAARVGISGVSFLEVRGGTITFAEDLDRLRGGLFKSSGDAVSTSAGRTPIPVHIEGLNLRWQPKSEVALALRGVRLDRREDSLKGAISHVSLARGAAELDVSEAAFELSWHDRVVKTVSAKQVVARLASEQLSGLLSAPAAVGTGTNAGGTSSPSAQPPSQQTGRGALLKLLELSPGRGERIRAKLADLARVISSRVPDGGRFSFDEVMLELQANEDTMRLGPARFGLDRKPISIELSFVPGYRSEHGVRLELSLPLEQGDVELRVEGGPLTLAELGVRHGDFGIARPESTRLTVRADGRIGSDARVATFSSSGSLSGLSLEHHALAQYPLTDIQLDWGGSGEFALDGSHLAIDSADVQLGSAGIQVSLEALRDTERLSLVAQADIPLGSCQKMFDSLPNGMAPNLNGTKLDGTFSWHLGVDLDTDQLSEMKADWRMQNDCKFLDVPPDVEPERFRHPFRMTVPDELGAPMDVWSGPGTREWIPLHDVSRYLEVAVLVTEDGRFWSHDGFDRSAIESSIRQNVKQGRYVRGASTISMQLAKNLYLSRRKTIARKIEEALLTALLEQELRKDEILELYLNVIEYAPGVFGVQPAAEYYFRALPEELSVAQSFFLASVLPAPSHQHFDDQGRLTPNWSNYLRSLMRIAHKRNRLSAEELESGLAEELKFGQPHDSEPARGSGRPTPNIFRR